MTTRHLPNQLIQSRHVYLFKLSGIIKLHAWIWDTGLALLRKVVFGGVDEDWPASCEAQWQMEPGFFCLIREGGRRSVRGETRTP